MVKKSKPKTKNVQALDKKLAQAALKEKVKQLRPYVKRLKKIDLRKPIPNKIAKKIDDTFTEYQELTTRPVKIFRSRNKKHLQEIKEWSRQERNVNTYAFDVAFAPTPDPKTKFIFKKGKPVKAKIFNVVQEMLFFDLEKMAKNPEKEIADTIARGPQKRQTSYHIMAGKYLYNGGLHETAITNDVLMLMKVYDDTEANNFWANWLFGLSTTEYETIDEYKKYWDAYQDQVAAAKDEKGVIRRAWERRYNRKAYATGDKGKKKTKRKRV